MSELVLVTGGVRSGKSSYAQTIAAASGAKVFYIATAEALDPDMKKRIIAHKRSRSKTWFTVEEPIRIVKAIKSLPEGNKAVILDCLTLFISNLIFKGLSDKAVCGKIKAVLKALKQKSDAAIVVTNEVGSGIVPDSKLGRRFRDLQGRVNQIVSGEADCVYLLVSGIPVKIK
ncbi:MAG: bifunctional adenosylcobinamide kinase/adenosylcobinamide-phosphate guanylyltransferase [Candidatus Omnitrophota bacterium]|nr:bifunctional adenosylcobinamide kinase/adenosylcobinamide-phosphate guanylyltransferase [Candidatus Omnitrophota bacterium]